MITSLGQLIAANKDRPTARWRKICVPNLGDLEDSLK